jgi:hypothetical protein
MEHLTAAERIVLGSYNDRLVQCKTRINGYCSALEQCLGDCAELMHDTESRIAMKKCRKTAAEIKAVLSAVDRVLERLEQTVAAPEASCDAQR